MMAKEEIWEVLESCAIVNTSREPIRSMTRATPSLAEVAITKKLILKFIEQLDGDESAIDIIEALQDYKPHQT